jgi:hypothetical protein
MPLRFLLSCTYVSFVRLRLLFTVHLIVPVCVCVSVCENGWQKRKLFNSNRKYTTSEQAFYFKRKKVVQERTNDWLVYLTNER